MARRSYHQPVAKRGWSEGSIYRTADGKWRVAVSLGSDAFGKRQRKEWQCRSEAEATRRLREVNQRLRGGLPAEESRVTLAAYTSEWLAGVRPSVRPTTYAFYATLAEGHLRDIAHLPLVRIGPADVRRLIARHLEQGYSSRTVRGVVDVLRMILKQAQSDGIVTRNVAELVARPKLEQAEPRHFTAEQARRFLAAARRTELYAFFAVALGTGLRKGELLALTWRDVDLDAGTIAVRRSKTAAGVRAMPLPPFATEALRELDRGIGPIWPSTQWLVTTRMNSVCDAAGLERIGMHGLRHSTASLLFAEGVPDFVIQSILGHSRVGMTKHYTHIEVEQQRDAMHRLGRAVG